MKTIGIIGLGFVGGALYEGMKHAFEIVVYDKEKGYREWKSKLTGPTNYIPETEGLKKVLEESDGPIFVCVPTPMNPDGSCNTSIVEGIVAKLNELNEGGDPKVVTIKSTVVPGTTAKLNVQCSNLHVCFNPEFLTERNYIDDFKNQDRIIVGGPRGGTNVLKQLYATAYPNVPVTKTSSTIAELVKYTTNCFLAAKVSVANEIEQICDELQVDYDKVIEYATKDKRLGQSHWAVPGPDGKHGFGGSCFPKDLNGLISLAESLNIDAHTLKGAWATNLKVRPEKDWEQLKGRAVNPS